jgi:hypothetical protein
MAVTSSMVPLGTALPDVVLPDLDGSTVRLHGYDAAALLVAFVCNHCPYVKHVERVLGQLVAEAGPRLATVGICTNDATAYPDDARHGWPSNAPGPAGTSPTSSIPTRAPDGPSARCARRTSSSMGRTGAWPTEERWTARPLATGCQ